MKLSRILITPGEPAGIGPDVLIQAAQRGWNADLIAVTDPDLIKKRAHEINLPIQIIECDLAQTEPQQHQPGTLRIHPVKFPNQPVAGKLNLKNAYAVLECLQIAAITCMEKQADAIVTGPIQKAIMNNAGIAFTGHTEYLAQLADVKQTVMLFVVDQLKAALVTTHIPLQKVSAAITAEKLTSVLTILNHDLKKYFHLSAPRFLVAGLNPHAGESGHLGSEEINIIAPVLDKLRMEGLNLEGPLPADTIFTPAVLQDADAVVGMYHDQILPVIKYIGFDRAVNMTLGLPFLRTSVDHGTALDIAGSGKSNPGSLCAAIQAAIDCAA